MKIEFGYLFTIEEAQSLYQEATVLEKAWSFQDKKKAYDIYCQLKASSFWLACFRLAVIYEKGELGQTQNVDLAMEHYALGFYYGLMLPGEERFNILSAYFTFFPIAQQYLILEAIYKIAFVMPRVCKNFLDAAYCAIAKKALDIETLLTHYQRAVTAGHKECLLDIATYKKAALEVGSSQAWYSLGYIYQFGVCGETSDYPSAMAAYWKCIVSQIHAGIINLNPKYMLYTALTQCYGLFVKGVSLPVPAEDIEQEIFNITIQQREDDIDSKIICFVLYTMLGKRTEATKHALSVHKSRIQHIDNENLESFGSSEKKWKDWWDNVESYCDIECGGKPFESLMAELCVPAFMASSSPLSLKDKNPLIMSPEVIRFYLRQNTLTKDEMQKLVGHLACCLFSPTVLLNIEELLEQYDGIFQRSQPEVYKKNGEECWRMTTIEYAHCLEFLDNYRPFFNLVTEHRLHDRAFCKYKELEADWKELSERCGVMLERMLRFFYVVCIGCTDKNIPGNYQRDIEDTAKKYFLDSLSTFLSIRVKTQKEETPEKASELKAWRELAISLRRKTTPFVTSFLNRSLLGGRNLSGAIRALPEEIKNKPEDKMEEEPKKTSDETPSLNRF